jgi:precorrin-4/cobalt-precorrin-4 C11-methyltransferase
LLLQAFDRLAVAQPPLSLKSHPAMTVHFIKRRPWRLNLLHGGRGYGCCQRVCLYAGSLVARRRAGHCPPGAHIVNTASTLSCDARYWIEIGTAHDAGPGCDPPASGDLLSVCGRRWANCTRTRARGRSVHRHAGVRRLQQRQPRFERTLPDSKRRSVVLTVPQARIGAPAPSHAGPETHLRPVPGHPPLPSTCWRAW